MIDHNFEDITLQSSLSGNPDIQNLINIEGLTYKEFRKALKPDRRVIFKNMLFPCLMIMIPLIIFIILAESLWWSAFLIFPFALWISFWMHAYTIHFHEAAHFNIHPNRKVNDLLSDIFLTPFKGLRVKDYRVSHWKHHQFLGLLKDTEISYHEPISFIHALEGLTGVYLAKSVMRYCRNFRDIDSQFRTNKKKLTAFILSLGLFLIFQSLLAAALFYLISFPAALSWIFSIFVTGPFIEKLRQTLEHRSYTAQKKTDYSEVAHGPVNRIFGTDFFSSYFGAAGFNRHLLHHWDPSVSYTCFDQLEKFMLDTSIKDILEANRTTYIKTFFALAKQG